MCRIDNLFALPPPLRYANRFTFLMHRRGQLTEAIAHYKEALALDPKYPDAENFLDRPLLETVSRMKRSCTNTEPTLSCDSKR